MAPGGKSAAKAEGVTCAFCGKGQREVAKMICGPSTACICNECVERCAEILAEVAEIPVPDIAEEPDGPERA